MRVNGFILAGGKSRRLGRDKAFLEWGGQSLLEHMIDLLATTANQVQVLGREPLPDRLAGIGPLGGIITALEVSDTERSLVVALDLPLLTSEFLRYFRSRLESSNRFLLACKIGSDFPLCLGIRRTLISVVSERIRSGNLSVRGLIESADAEILGESEVDAAGFERSIFVNINTEEDYQEALRSLQIRSLDKYI